MDRIDAMLREFFAPAAPPGLGARLGAALRAARTAARALDRWFGVGAPARGVRRLVPGTGVGADSPAARRHAARARAELAEYLAGRRTFFAVPLDLAGLPSFQRRVLAAARRIPFGATASYAELARRIGRPRAARAVGNALGANPVPVLVPCHRVVRGDGTWGPYAFGGAMKTALLRLERTTPALIGCTSTRIVCRRGCAHEQRVREAHRVVFASVADARSVGYRACRVCRPARAA